MTAKKNEKAKPGIVLNEEFPHLLINTKDRRREFCLDLGAFYWLEQHYSKKFGEPEFVVFDERVFNLQRMECIMPLLCAGLQTDADEHGETLEVKDVCKILSMENYLECIVLINKAFEKIRPELEGLEAENNRIKKMIATGKAKAKRKRTRAKSRKK